MESLGILTVNRRCYLASIALARGIAITIEHPRSSWAWKLPEIVRFMQSHGLRWFPVDWCMFTSGARPQKPTRLLSSMVWLPGVLKVCDGGHSHEPLGLSMGSRLKAIGAYPEHFCRALAQACIRWYGCAASAPPKPAGCL